MKMTIALICVLFVLDLMACSSYCIYKDQKASKNGAQKNNKASEVKESQQRILSKNTLRQKVILWVFMWMESILRINLLLIAYFPSHHVRNFFYRYVFRVHMGKNVVIYYGTEIRSPWNLYIGEGTVIGDRAILDARCEIHIGRDVNLSSGVWIWTLQHDVNDPYFATNREGRPVVVRDRAWLSCRSVILPGVTIAEGTVIAASAVVAKSTEAFSIYGGVPCKKIATRNSDLVYHFNGSHLHFL